MRPLTDGGYNVEDDGTCGFATATGSLPDTADPLLDPDGLQDNGGPTQTIALQPVSPAVDLVAEGECPPPQTDQRGVARPQGEACESGAYELARRGPTVVGTAPADGSMGVERGANLRARFSQRMDGKTIGARTFRLYEGVHSYEDLSGGDPPGPGSLVSGKVGYKAKKKAAVLDPSRRLKASTEYTAVVEGAGDTDSRAVESRRGRAMARDHLWRFKTEADDQAGNLDAPAG